MWPRHEVAQMPQKNLSPNSYHQNELHKPAVIECQSHTIGLEEAREMGELHDEQLPHAFQTLLEHVNDILDETLAQVRLLH